MKIMITVFLVCCSASARAALESTFAAGATLVSDPEWLWFLCGSVVVVASLLTLSLLARKLLRKKKKNDPSLKQGAYGKIRIHKESKLRQLMRPLEVSAALRLKFGGALKGEELGHGAFPASDDTEERKADAKFADVMLKAVSRSFAAVIAALPNDVAKPLRLAVGIFYLILRALDTVEDDMDLSRFEPFSTEADRVEAGGASATCAAVSLVTKQRLLRTFHLRLREEESAAQQQRLHDIGEGDEATLLAGMDRVLRLFFALPAPCRTVIADITEEMGVGMAAYIARDLCEGTEDKADFDQYCHLVAGTVGDGLTRLFAAQGLESPELVENYELWNDMGLFLQNTNIIRDYLEDLVDGRAFWPRTVYTKHVVELKDMRLDTPEGLADEGREERALGCLDEMVANALALTPHCLDYLGELSNLAVLRFCAVPQVMAIATLGAVFRNPKVFSGVVKVRKGLAARMVLACCTTTTVDQARGAYREWFAKSATQIKNKAVEALAGTPRGNDRAVVLHKIIGSCDYILRRVKREAAEQEERQQQQRAAQRASQRAQQQKQGGSSSTLFALRAMVPIALAVFVSCCYVLLSTPGISVSFAKSAGATSLKLAALGAMASLTSLVAFTGTLFILSEEENKGGKDGLETASTAARVARALGF